MGGNLTGPLILRRPTRSAANEQRGRWADRLRRRENYRLKQMNEALLQMEERYIAQLERPIARQEEIIEELVRDSHQRTAETARASDHVSEQPAAGAGACRRLKTQQC